MGRREIEVGLTLSAKQRVREKCTERLLTGLYALRICHNGSYNDVFTRLEDVILTLSITQGIF